MFANSIHLVDYLGHFGRGDIVDVTVGLPYDPAAPHSVSATVTFSSGDSGAYFGAWKKPGPWFVPVRNEETHVELRPLEELGVQKLDERVLTMMADDPRDVDFKLGLRHQASEFVRALAGQANTLPTLDDTTQSMRLVARTYGRG